MSGVVGILHLDGSPVDPRLLQQLTHCLSFRGPDALEIWSEGAVGFGHALLRTTREAAGERQPASRHGRWWITADARVDGRCGSAAFRRGFRPARPAPFSSAAPRRH